MTTQAQDAGGTSPYLSLAAALQAASDAAIVAVQRQTTYMYGGSAGSGPYKSVFDRGVLFSTIVGTGVQARVPIVAPKSSIFDAGTKKIVLTNPLIVAIQTQAMALLGDDTGHAIGPFTRGVRQRAKGN